ncbi:hypothetical protein KSP40_PGU003354 [Platanthera guangdongensis]|uniref:Uncharacterized protein n=1 Tax=Platanthera guangdongensis TaxID=2320717 RepID=A0ABR2LTU5_9ASPA
MNQALSVSFKISKPRFWCLVYLAVKVERYKVCFLEAFIFTGWRVNKLQRQELLCCFLSQNLKKSVLGSSQMHMKKGKSELFSGAWYLQFYDSRGLRRTFSFSNFRLP